MQHHLTGYSHAWHYTPPTGLRRVRAGSHDATALWIKLKGCLDLTRYRGTSTKSVKYHPVAGLKLSYQLIRSMRDMWKQARETLCWGYIWWEPLTYLVRVHFKTVFFFQKDNNNNNNAWVSVLAAEVVRVGKRWAMFWRWKLYFGYVSDMRFEGKGGV